MGSASSSHDVKVLTGKSLNYSEGAPLWPPAIRNSSLRMSARPKGMPRKEWQALRTKKGAKAATRFLDFDIKTTQTNSGTQQYGAGQSMTRSTPAVKSMGNMRSTMAPVREPRTGPRGPTLIKEREFLMDVVVEDGQYFVEDFTIQPGMLFPWGSEVAKQYEEYKVVSMQFEYVPIVSAFATAGTQGRVLLCANYDALEGAPPDMRAAQAMQPHVPGMASTPITLSLDPRRLTPVTKFIRFNPVSGDLKTYDAGTFFVAVDGFVAPTLPEKIGEIHVSYSVELFNPRIGRPVLPICQVVRKFYMSQPWYLPSPAGPYTPNFLAQSCPTGTFTQISGFAFTRNAGTQALDTYEDVGCLPLELGTNSIGLPVGAYRITFQCLVRASAGVLLGSTLVCVRSDHTEPVGNGTALSIWAPGTAVGSLSSPNLTWMQGSMLMKVEQEGLSVQFWVSGSVSGAATFEVSLWEGRIELL